jgi:iron complex outermembrane receptor protein
MIPALGLMFIGVPGAFAENSIRSTVSVDTFPLIGAVSGDSVRTFEADSVYHASENSPLQFEMITVSGRRISRQAGADRIELDSELVESRDGGSIADLSTLLPSTKLTVNSRGESLFMVRGSSERHLRVELDGIPLTVPWDERVDLSMLPLLAIGEVEAQRGVASVLDEPNTLAGTVSLHTREQVLDGSASRFGSWAGEAGAWGVGGLHQRRHGNWKLLTAIEHRRRDGFVVSKESDQGLHQDPARRLRLNSQLEQSSALARVQRDFHDEGRWHLMVQASHGEKGVPPEEHLTDPRYWRYPEVQRILVGGRLETPFGRAWNLDTAASLDFFNQDIDAYPDREYLDRDGFEEDRDRTGFWRAGLGYGFGEHSDFRLRTTLRYAEHRETTDANPVELLYSQLLMGAAPESGDKPRREGDNEFALQAAVEGRFAGDGRWHLNGSHRPRMPSLRELYSGALGTFEPNDGLEPERQNGIETGLSWQASRWNLSLNGFSQKIDGAIERTTTPAGLKQRVNLDEVRNLGLEFGGLFKPGRGLSLDVQTTWLYSRAKDDEGNFDRRVEDRPDWLATLAATWTHRSGIRLRAELDGVGPRVSLDERKPDPLDPYTELETALRLNLRLSWRHFGQYGGYAGSEWFLRVDNILDEVTYSQLGLVESGRMLQAGVRVDFDR